MDKYVVVLITVPTIEIGKQIAYSLVEQRLAACVNLLPGVTSIYTWKGKVTEDQETLCLVKTRGGLLEEIISSVRKIHPYELSEIITLALDDGEKSYLKWIKESTVGI